MSRVRLEVLAGNVSFRQELECPICLELLTDPAILCCGHTFCGDCLRELCEWQNTTSCCPECREPMEPETWRPNRAAQRLSGAARARDELYCEQHDLRLRLYCHTDHSLICLGCRDSPEHREHEASPINEAVPEYKDKLEQEMTALKDRSAAFSRLWCTEQNKKVQKGLDSRLEELRKCRALDDIDFLKAMIKLRPTEIQTPSEVPLGGHKGPQQ
ncbi:E3 ubiquitin-protein ligase TRIM17-like [Leucoraja erinacea]|uniref:E3 ubiquitin-protein ligase TRIM17-like n=1 Tax=Leucoraja erinaceus TaxID=7782 RepID=UPI00245866FB|nr:E3 ubiquitin-protein ligase TRIM17-like [Leucoraja erinacea]